ncbi:MAG: hypothetical protein R2825_17380 [Saprospiraceae bacterium]
MKGAMEQGEQAIFQSRRSYCTQPALYDLRLALECVNCDVTLTYS